METLILFSGAALILAVWLLMECHWAKEKRTCLFKNKKP